MKDLFLITGEIDRLKELSIKMERKLFEPTDPEDVDYETLTEMVEEVEDVVGNLANELRVNNFLGDKPYNN